MHKAKPYLSLAMGLKRQWYVLLMKAGSHVSSTDHEQRGQSGCHGLRGGLCLAGLWSVLCSNLFVWWYASFGLDKSRLTHDSCEFPVAALTNTSNQALSIL